MPEPLADTSPKSRVLSLRLDVASLARLSAVARSAGLTPGRWARRALLGVLESLDPKPSPVAPPATPDAAGRLTETISGRVSAEQFETVRVRAEECGLSVAAYVRATVLGATPRARRPQGLKAIAELNRVGNNLNQLTKLANSGSVFPSDLALAVAAVGAAVRQLREALEVEET